MNIDDFIELISFDPALVKAFYAIVDSESVKKAEKLALYWLQYCGYNTEGFDSEDFREFCRDHDQEFYYGDDDDFDR